MIFACALLAGAAPAAELGEPRVGSFIGQPLVADIELTMLEDAATPVQVRLASPNVYRGASIGMPAVLSTLRMSVMRRDGRQFLHLTSLGPVESEHLHLYLELADGSQRAVRLATLWLSPDPHPAPPAPVAAPPVQPQTAAKAAEPAPPAAPAPAPAPKAAPKAAPKPTPKPAPKPHIVSRPAPPAAPPTATEAAPPKLEPAAPAGACAPQPRQQVDACVMLGAKNALLRERLDQLEDKVKVLQVAAGASPASVMQASATSGQVHKPKKKKPEPPPETGSPWLMAGAGAGVLALLAGLWIVLRRRRGAPRAGARGPGLGARLKARLGRKPEPVAAAEPTLEQDAHNSSTQV
ncbi:FimV family protein [Massilia sp. X63]|uniref:type IV pilus assembly protein FimV n=1 Tax=Massilia sp. X63 TaxID=3237285 RepID=UPI0034DD2F9A